MLIGAIPTALIILYTETFVGNAVLHDHDPDVYEPRHWEYYKVNNWISILTTIHYVLF